MRAERDIVPHLGQEQLALQATLYVPPNYRAAIEAAAANQERIEREAMRGTVLEVLMPSGGSGGIDANPEPVNLPPVLLGREARRRCARKRHGPRKEFDGETYCTNCGERV